MGKSRRSSSRPNTKIEEELKVVSESSLRLLVVEVLKAQEGIHGDEIKTLTAELFEIKSSQEFLCNEFDKLKSECQTLRAINKQQAEEITQLKAHSAKLESRGKTEEEKVDVLEQYGRRQYLEISGIPEKEGENTNKLVIEVAKLANVELSPNQISISHRLPPKIRHSLSRNTSSAQDVKFSNSPPKSSSIIVRFVSRDIRNQIFRNRNLLRNADLKNFSVIGTDNIFINENLTHSKKKLFWKVKQKAKASQYKFYWTSNGNIFVRKSEEFGSILIKNENDLNLIC